MQALLHDVPTGGMVVLDLRYEVAPIWSLTESYYGTPFIWNMLHNFGGRSGLYGRMPQIAQWPALALQSNATFVDMCVKCCPIVIAMCAALACLWGLG